MRLRIDETGFVLHLSASDTSRWARASGRSWPCSTMEGSRFVLVYDSNGLCDGSQDGKELGDVDGRELDSCVADHVARRLPDSHPWKSELLSRLALPIGGAS
jgi:hypothetical protein